MRVALQTMIQLTGGKLVAGPASAEITGAAVDSRRIRRGDVFIAMPGAQTDGHRYVAQAAAAGAAAALVERWPLPQQAPAQGWDPTDGEIPHTLSVVKVDDTLRALQRWARAHRDRFDVPVVAVTGSVGKTTTKDMIAAVLAAQGAILKSPGNFNTDIGLPLALLAWQPHHRAVVFELAMRQKGEIAELCAILRPTIGVVTNIGPSHLALLGSLDAIAEAKAELVDALPADGIAILNADDERVLAMAERALARVMTYGLNEKADVRAEDLSYDDEGRLRFRLLGPLGAAEVRLPLCGEHFVGNALAAAAVAYALGLPPAAVQQGLASYRGAPQRMQVATRGGVTVIDDTYNANPLSMRAALRAAHRLASGRRLVVALGDMLELGPESADLHATLGREAAAVSADLYFYGPETAAAAAAARAARPEATVVHDLDQATLIRKLTSSLVPGDVVLCKGSRGMRMERVVEAVLASAARSDGRAHA